MLDAKFIIQNLSKKDIVYLAQCYVNKLFWKKKYIEIIIAVDYTGTYLSSMRNGNFIPGAQNLPLSIKIYLYNKPKLALQKSLKVKLSIFDTAGNKQTLKVVFNSSNMPNNDKPKLLQEIPSLIDNPVEKNIVSILQSELNFYSKQGRSSGGLGSINTYIPGCTPGQPLNGIKYSTQPAFSYQEKQIISNNPLAASIKSKNLDAIMTLYNQCDSDKEKQEFIAHFIDRIDENKEYINISYFLVLVLFKLGYLKKALDKIKKCLPQGDVHEYEFSNILILLDGLLYYGHPDFNNELLDYIEILINSQHDANSLIQEKIYEIRNLRIIKTAIL